MNHASSYRHCSRRVAEAPQDSASTGPYRRGASALRRGFSLIEVIASITVLAIIVLMVGRLFADAQSAMLTGTRSAESTTNARAVLDFMARDIQNAIFDDPSTAGEAPYLYLRVLGTASTSLSTNNILGQRLSPGRELYFFAPVRVQSGGDSGREIAAIGYWLREQTPSGGSAMPYRYELMRGIHWRFRGNASRDPYLDSGQNIWESAVSGTLRHAVKSAGGVVIQNLRSVRFNYISANRGTDPRAIQAAGDARSDQTPLAYLDIHLELFSPHDARRAADLFSGTGASSTSNAFVERTIRRFHQRIHFLNSHGYYRASR